jgi:hypothetical protein
VLIFTTSVRYVTILEATPLNANLSTPATTANEAAQRTMNNYSNLNPTVQNS